jgi:flavin-dependent dehydrogenase
MSDGNRYNVIIIGTGAGGGMLAYKLAPSGKRILLTERGGYVRREAAVNPGLTIIANALRVGDHLLERPG